MKALPSGCTERFFPSVVRGGRLAAAGRVLVWFCLAGWLAFPVAGAMWLLFAPAVSENLAAGISYKCVVPPNYWGWKNLRHSDMGQLTDGVIGEQWDTDQRADLHSSRFLGLGKNPSDYRV